MQQVPSRTGACLFTHPPPWAGPCPHSAAASLVPSFVPALSHPFLPSTQGRDCHSPQDGYGPPPLLPALLPQPPITHPPPSREHRGGPRHYRHSQVHSGRSPSLPALALLPGWRQEATPSAAPAHPDDALAGGEGQPHQARPVDGHEAVPDAQLARPLRGAPVHQVGDDHCGQDGAPARLHDGDAQDLPLLLPDADLVRSTDGLWSPEPWGLRPSPSTGVLGSQPAVMGPSFVGSTSAAQGAVEGITQRCQRVPHTVPTPPKQLLRPCSSPAGRSGSAPHCIAPGPQGHGCTGEGSARSGRCCWPPGSAGRPRRMPAR